MSYSFVDKLTKIPITLIVEIIIIIFIINIIFSYIYHQIYMNDNTSFIYGQPINKKDIPYFDFFYYANTTFFALGYDIIPQNKIAKIMSMIQLNLSFLITTLVFINLNS